MAQKGGTIAASWSVTGNTGTTDYLEIEVCDSNDNCEITRENRSVIAMSLDGQTETVHGVTYTFNMYMCNVAGCDVSNKAGPESATADNKVDGGVTATSMGISNGDNAWTVTWDVDGDQSDVAGWMVCYNRGGWSVAGDMPSDCVDAGMSTTADVSNTGLPAATYFFTAVPYDDKGNMETAMPGTDILLAGEIDDCVVTADEDCDEGTVDGADDSAESGEVPAWTWGVIIGLVVIAFVVGAFILSRGGDGEGGEDWDY